MEVLSAFSSN